MKRCRRKPCRVRRRGLGTSSSDCWDLVDKVRKATARYQSAEEAIYFHSRYRKGEDKRAAVARLEKQKAQLDALNARYVELGC